MPVFHKDGRNLLFIHIPKCGGSAVERAFQADGWTAHYLDGTVGRGTPGYVRWCTPQHMHADMLRTFFRIERFDAVFALVRDPISRLRSEYLWRLRKKAEIPLDAASVDRWARKAFHTYRGNRFIHDNHIRPQSQFVLREANVHRLEDGIDTMFAALATRTGLELPTTVPQVRTGEELRGAPSSAVEVSPRLEKRIRAFYRSDYRAFGY